MLKVAVILVLLGFAFWRRGKLPSLQQGGRFQDLQILSFAAAMSLTCLWLRDYVGALTLGDEEPRALAFQNGGAIFISSSRYSLALQGTMAAFSPAPAYERGGESDHLEMVRDDGTHYDVLFRSGERDGLLALTIARNSVAEYTGITPLGGRELYQIGRVGGSKTYLILGSRYYVVIEGLEEPPRFEFVR